MSTPPLDPTTARRRSLLQSLWFWVVLAFLILIGAWSTIILLAVKHSPQTIEVEQQEQPIQPITEQPAPAPGKEASPAPPTGE